MSGTTIVNYLSNNYRGKDKPRQDWQKHVKVPLFETGVVKTSCHGQPDKNPLQQTDIIRTSALMKFIDLVNHARNIDQCLADQHDQTTDVQTLKIHDVPPKNRHELRFFVPVGTNKHITFLGFCQEQPFKLNTS